MGMQKEATMGILQWLDNYQRAEDYSTGDKQTKEFELLLARTMNCFGFNPSSIYEEEHTKKAEELLSRFAMHWINYFGTLPIRTLDTPYGAYTVSIEGGYDRHGIFRPGRNYYMREACAKYASDPAFIKAFEPMRFDYVKSREMGAWERFIEGTLRRVDYDMHKTIQQTTTKLMIYAADQKTGKTTRAYLPMI